MINTHGGSASPDYGEHPGSQLLWLMETTWFSHRPFWTLVLSGVFDRFPALRMSLAEQGSGWIPAALEAMDGHYSSIAGGGIGELRSLDELRLRACRASSGARTVMSQPASCTPPIVPGGR